MSLGAALPLRVSSAELTAAGVLLLELRADEPFRPLPGFASGAHIDLELGPRTIRSYSLLDTSDPAPVAYRIAVKREDAGRGGSVAVHALKVGDVVPVRPPVNDFPLAEGASHTVFVAGGIGVTPVLAHARRLTAIGASWEAHYAFRVAEPDPFAAVLQALGGERVHLYGPGTPRPEVAALVAGAAPGAHLYCCGPASMITDFAAATGSLDPTLVHVERFRSDPVLVPAPVVTGASEAPAPAGRLKIELAASGQVLEVPEEETILDVVLDEGIDVEFSCMDGICGSCRTTVLEGEPDHRDSVLTDEEREAGDCMLICISRAKGDRLVLDL
ncbi:PDR/VanB family oxidoreductase [Pseudonocardia dioxanivorans]|jgi:ferredoxin-NADP reductase|uniref:PDR/VanB family oxidoreductase n=1 Tax=Pseudonocardia dioxanivorans TaxID=240495 RepID=UPI000CD272D7|nr:PDR/VanB family oxidoreductase [Pseudonocardia dioxanivorans]